MTPVQTTKMSNFRWVICALLFLATTVNYMDRQVLSLTWKDFIAADFHWTDADYGFITGMFSLFYAIANIFAGKFIDWMGTKKGYLIAIFVWSTGAVLHAGCGWVTMNIEGYPSIEALRLFLPSVRQVTSLLPSRLRRSISLPRIVRSPPLSSTVAHLWVHSLHLPRFPCWLVRGAGRWLSSSSVCWVMCGWACGSGCMTNPARISA